MDEMRPDIEDVSVGIVVDEYAVFIGFDLYIHVPMIYLHRCMLLHVPSAVPYEEVW